MSRAEFAELEARARVASPVAPLRAESGTDLETEPGIDAGLKVLLIDDDGAAAERTRAQLHTLFGGHAACDWVSERDEGVALLKENLHHICLLADATASGDSLAVLGEAEAGGSNVPVIVLSSGDADTGSDAVDAGAADSLERNEATHAALERSIRRTLARQTRLVRAQQEIAALTSEKARLNVLRDANHRFVENACHDFRSPLTVIKEFASIISEGLAGDVNEEQAEFLEIILTRVDQLSQMVDGILDASRLESDLIGVKRVKQNIAGLIENVRPTLEQTAAAKKVSIEFSVPDDLPDVFADTESVGRVITNLGANAAKYAGEAGTIRVWARYAPGSREVTIGVSDSGPGIAPEHVKLIFDRFQQIADDKQSEKGGFGLGLHIASELVRINFGTLSVESTPGKGSTFAFTLPVFDVDSLIPLHFAFLKTSRHSFQKVTIAMVKATAQAGSTALSDIEKLLNRQLRSYDLLLPLRAANWLACIACDESEVSQIIGRILDSRAQTSHNRPDGPLPELSIRPVGTWPLTARPDGLNEAIRGAFAPTDRQAG